MTTEDSTRDPYAIQLGVPHPDSPGELELHRRHVERGRLPGFEFNVEVMSYVVDLFHREAKVIGEVDGFTYHDADRERAQRDRKRDRRLQSFGYQVYRFTSDEVIEGPLGAITCLEDAVKDRLAGTVRREPPQFDLAAMRRARENRPPPDPEIEAKREAREHIKRMTRLITNWYLKTDGPAVSASIARYLNSELMGKYGRIGDRDLSALIASWLDLYDQWVQLCESAGLDVIGNWADYRYDGRDVIEPPFEWIRNR